MSCPVFLDELCFQNTQAQAGTQQSDHDDSHDKTGFIGPSHVEVDDDAASCASVEFPDGISSNLITGKWLADSGSGQDIVNDKTAE